ncbi:alpha/beta hydrolase [Amycolatopsis sp. NBC_01488]|uniref:alpha/beta fold hydrolase n=1 Tax=Amycolatopsis sp. NBC_01488 TaxID=2903563 RepID=UPI002E2A2403|nr:alpha/beta hydrolase [Amycolatopsis sp. NBC_01488]
MTDHTHHTAPTGFVEAKGVRFAYRRFGNGPGRPIVLVQHFMGNLDNFDPAITDGLAAGREVVLFDNTGVGASSGTAPNTVDGMARDAAALIDALGLSDIDLFGFSMGGHVAQMIALHRPELVRRLVLVGTGPRGGDGMAAMDPAVVPLFGRRDELGEAMWLPIMFSPTDASQAAGRRYVERITARTQNRDDLVSQETILNHRAAANEWGRPGKNSFGYLAEISAPTLVVNGSNDIVVPTVNSYHLQQHIPDAELLLFPDSSHGSHFQYPRRFLRRLHDFLDVQADEKDET